MDLVKDLGINEYQAIELRGNGECRVKNYRWMINGHPHRLLADAVDSDGVQSVWRDETLVGWIIHTLQDGDKRILEFNLVRGEVDEMSGVGSLLDLWDNNAGSIDRWVRMLLNQLNGDDPQRGFPEYPDYDY